MASSDHSADTAGEDRILSVRDASVTFDMERGESRVLDRASLDIDRKDIVGIVGESGSGKSMFANALLDSVVDPGRLTGEVTYYPEDGEPVDVLELSDRDLKRYRWERVSMVFQGAMSSFNPTLDIGAHFQETFEAHDTDVVEGFERARELMEDLYLDPDRVLESYPHELSGGMKQRALIALALVLDPEVLVMDEPTAALDLLMQQSIVKLLAELQDKYDLTMVFITHDLPLVMELCNRVVVMYAFQFVERGPTDEILTNAAHPYTRALLNATPNTDAPIDEMTPIEGSAPDPVNVPEGCSYHPRCPLATDECRAEDPHDHDVTPDHTAACFHWDEAADAIPFSYGADETVSVSAASGDAVQPSGEPVLSLEEVDVHFEQEGGGLLDVFTSPDTVHAVDDVTLDIMSNDVIALVGESGCGKTTLGKTAIGVQEPTGGSIKYRGQDIWEAKRGRGDIPWKQIRRSLQIIHQDPESALNPHEKVSTILETPLKRWQDDLNREDRRARILAMLEHVGMTPPDDYAGRFPHQLSGGEQQRIALIRALLMNPDVILADEAISALDVSLRVEMMDLFLDLQDRFGTSFIFISHDLSNARYLAEKSGGRIGIMYLGELVEIGPAEQIIHDPKHPYTQALNWATPSLTRDVEAAGEVPLRTIDVPDAVNPPSGCRFHTRCPKVIPPDDLSIEQETFNAIMDLRNAIDEGELPVEYTWQQLGVGEDDPRDPHVDEFVTELRSAFFDRELPSAERQHVDRALEQVARDDHAGAADTLRDRYESICETQHPELPDIAHPAACHLFEQPDSVTGAEPVTADD